MTTRFVRHAAALSRLCWIIATIIMTTGILNGVAIAENQLPVPKIHAEKYTLKNGLEVIVAEDHRLPLVAVNLWYHVGPANEREGRTGFAHLFEHMMFEGSQHVGPKAHNRYLEAAGASEINGSTDFESDQLLRDFALESVGTCPVA